MFHSRQYLGTVGQVNSDWLSYNHYQGWLCNTRCQAMTPSTLVSFSTLAATASDLAFSGAVVVPNGKIICIPYDHTKIGIFDPSTGTYTDGPTAGSGASKFSGAVMHTNGKVYLVPHDYTNVGEYDPDANTYADKVYAGASGVKFSGGHLMPDGKIWFMPDTTRAAAIYDPVADTITAGPNTNMNVVGCMTTFERFVMRGSGSLFVYNILTSTMATTSGLTSGEFGAAILAPNGKVVFVPKGRTNIEVYDTLHNRLTAGPAVPSSATYRGACLTADGRVAMFPLASADTRILLFDAKSLTYEYGPTTGTGAGGAAMFWGAILAPNGKIYPIPYRFGNFSEFDLLHGTVGTSNCMHPTVNRGF